jgi:hypothetical protein
MDEKERPMDFLPFLAKYSDGTTQWALPSS